jgi:predicted pyridoxine 5'-phosphate oxidase superfamily flavin-nucleotide-binding protein
MGDALFHQGELTLQAQVGSRERLAETAHRLIRPALTEKHQDFFRHLPMVFIGAADRQGRVWASVRFGAGGFVQAPEADSLSLGGQMLADDPLAGSLTAGQRIALLGLVAQIRRRNRVNGLITQADGDSLTLAVEQSYGNCAKYIHPRTVELVPDLAEAAAQDAIPFTAALCPQAQQMIATADTFFIASLHPQEQAAGRSQGADVSHRGGAPGFVRLLDSQTLMIPDYSGNQYFNTLGNIVLNPSVGLLFIDYQTAGLLWVSGQAEVIDEPTEVAAYPGAERLLRVTVQACRRAQAPLPLRWQAALDPVLALP